MLEIGHRALSMTIERDDRSDSIVRAFFFFFFLLERKDLTRVDPR